MGSGYDGGGEAAGRFVWSEIGVLFSGWRVAGGGWWVVGGRCGGAWLGWVGWGWLGGLEWVGWVDGG